MNLGPDIFRSANRSDTENSSLKLSLLTMMIIINGQLDMKSKEWDIYNVFIVAQNGSYSFDGISGYESQQATVFFHNNSRDLTEAGGAAIFKYDLHLYYIQDEIESLIN